MNQRLLQLAAGSSLLLALSSLPFGCADDESAPLGPLDQALAAVGGRDALIGMTSFRLDVQGTRYFPGEQYQPSDEPPKANDYAATISYDIAGDQLRLDWRRTVFFLLEIDHTFSEIVRGDVGTTVGTDGLFGGANGDILAAGTAALRRDQRFLNPHLLLREAALDPSRVSDGGDAELGGREHHRLILSDDIAPLTLWIDAESGRISQVDTQTSDPLLRDATIEVVYGGTWQQSLFPSQVDYFIAGELLQTEQRTAAETNPSFDANLFDFPAEADPMADAEGARFGRLHHVFHQNFAGIGLRLDAVQSFVDATELAPGVFFLAGGSHNSLAIEQADGVVLVEAPLYGERSRALEAWAAAQFPQKPITHVIATHYHDDHSGGVREMAGSGAVVVAGAPAESFYRGIFSARSALDPDSFTGDPNAAPFIGVSRGTPVTLADANNPVAIHAIANPHAYDLVIVELPNQSIVFESDLFNPGFPPGLPVSWAVSLRDAMIDLDIADSTIVGGHGGIASYADLEAFTQQ